LWEGQQQTLDDKPNLRRWLETVSARPAVIEGRALLAEKRGDHSSKDAQKALFKTK